MIDATDTFTLGAVLLACVTASFWAERTRLGQNVGGPLIVLFLSMALANLGVIPHASGLYDTIGGLLVPLAIPLLMLRADIRRVLRDGGPLLRAFLLAVVFTVAGGVAAFYLVDLGEIGPQVAGTLVASYIGGSLNFVATAKAVGLDDPSLYSVAMSADAVGAVFFLMVLMSLPALAWVRRAMPSRYLASGEAVATAAILQPEQPAELMQLHRISLGLALSLLLCAIAQGVAAVLEADSLFILVLTVLALVMANAGSRIVRHVQYDFELGTLFMYIFFAAIGAGADIALVIDTALPMLWFIATVVIVHLLLLLSVGSFLRLDLADVMIASNACILGPAPAAALAASRGWRGLVSPGMLVGLLGYAIATFIGIALTRALG